MDGFQYVRNRMVSTQLEARGIKDPSVLGAMRKVPRHLFLEEGFNSHAYLDKPVPIGFGQTISQPYVVALMSQLLEARPGMKVLEIGTGSGYQAAVLYEMGLEVYSVERLKELFCRTSDQLIRLHYRRIRLKLADGTCGWPEAGPFDRIIVTAGGPSLPPPLLEQLADPGILVVPVGKDRREQRLVRVVKNGGQVHTADLGGVSFVDLVGNHGWKVPDERR